MVRGALGQAGLKYEKPVFGAENFYVILIINFKNMPS
jgi:hypothetical protein